MRTFLFSSSGKLGTSVLRRVLRILSLWFRGFFSINAAAWNLAFSLWVSFPCVRPWMRLLCPKNVYKAAFLHHYPIISHHLRSLGKVPQLWASPDSNLQEELSCLFSSVFSWKLKGLLTYSGWWGSCGIFDDKRETCEGMGKMRTFPCKYLQIWTNFASFACVRKANPLTFPPIDTDFQRDE